MILNPETKNNNRDYKKCFNFHELKNTIHTIQGKLRRKHLQIYEKPRAAILNIRSPNQ